MVSSSLLHVSGGVGGKQFEGPVSMVFSTSVGVFLDVEFPKAELASLPHYVRVFLRPNLFSSNISSLPHLRGGLSNVSLENRSPFMSSSREGGF